MTNITIPRLRPVSLPALDACGFIGPWRRPTNQHYPIVEREVLVARAYLTNLRVTRTPDLSSYGLKHCAERWWGEYVSNGALITAAIDLSLPLKLVEINAMIGVDCRDVIRMSRR
jgi:hypothetical protein